MFCPNCGTQLIDGGGFCPKCGARLAADSADQSSATSAPAGMQMKNIQMEKPKKKKRGKKLAIFGIVVLAVVIILIVAGGDGSTDYKATVRAHKPFAESQGLPYTYGEVLDKYITSPDWKVKKSNDIGYVNISGTAKGTEMETDITIKVSPTDDPDTVLIKPESVTIDEEKSTDPNEAAEFLLLMFSAYDEGYSDLSELLSDSEE